MAISKFCSTSIMRFELRALLLSVILSGIVGACRPNGSGVQPSAADETEDELARLTDSIRSIISSAPGEIGVALITGRGDTVAVNNEDKYPLMSVFKLHQAIFLCDLFDRTGWSLDTVVAIPRSQMNPSTWSPMLKDHDGDTIDLSVRELLVYTLTLSDNNASNYLFSNFQSVAETDSFIAGLIPRESFRLSVTEDEMWLDHDLCYKNHSSPLGAAVLLNRLVCDSIISQGSGGFLLETLRKCVTGADRIVAPLGDKTGVEVAHKTGSGFTKENGVLTAHNDVAFVTLPDGGHYTLAILVKDFHGSESEASAIMARISALVYNTIII